MPGTLGFEGTGIRESCEEVTSKKSTLTQGVPKLLFILPWKKEDISHENTVYKEPVMCPWATEGVPILNIEASNSPWIAREKTVIDHLRKG